MKMKISDAKKRIARQRLIAVAIMAIAALFLACSGLKSIYFALPGDTTALSTLTQALQRLVYAIYERTQFVAWFWEWAPVINTKEPNTAGNFGLFPRHHNCAAMQVDRPVRGRGMRLRVR